MRRSSILDKWTRDNIAFMVAGGNRKCREFMKARGWTQKGADNRKEKYSSKAAKLYRQHLQREAK